jgi:hypothetical protein
MIRTPNPARRPRHQPAVIVKRLAVTDDGLLAG